PPLPRVPTLPPAVPGVRLGCRTRAVRPPGLGHGRPVLHRLRPPLIAHHGRPLQSPHPVVHVWFSERTISCAVKGRTRTPPVSGGPQPSRPEMPKKPALWAVSSSGVFGWGHPCIPLADHLGRLKQER